MDAKQLERLIQTVIAVMRLYSVEAIDLLMLTAAQESHLGKYIQQLGNGPARGIFQMEPKTLQDLYDNFLKYNKQKADVLQSFRTSCSLETDLTGNLLFQIAAARLQYHRKQEKLPVKASFTDDSKYITALAKYWKTHWNTNLGKGTVQEATQNYYKYVINV